MDESRTPAQRAALAVVDANGAAMIANQTRRNANTVHVSAARALVRAGVLVESIGPDGTFVSRAT